MIVDLSEEGKALPWAEERAEEDDADEGEDVSAFLRVLNRTMASHTRFFAGVGACCCARARTSFWRGRGVLTLCLQLWGNRRSKRACEQNHHHHSKSP